MGVLTNGRWDLTLSAGTDADRPEIYLQNTDSGMGGAGCGTKGRVCYHAGNGQYHRFTGGGGTCSIASGTGNTACTSDARLKQDVAPISDALDKLSSFDGIYYRWNEKAKMMVDKESKHLGVIAQEVRKVFPEAVLEDENGYLSVSLDALVPPLIEAVKELKAQNEALRAEMLGSKGAPSHTLEARTAIAWPVMLGMLLAASLLGGIISTLVMHRKS
ncbi:MAG: tail fiber domain-containing protein [Rickettsiales bacterium]